MKVNHIYYYYNLWFLYYGTGVFIRHRGSCPIWDGIGHAGLYWLLLHRKTGYPRRAQSWNTQSCPWTLSSAPGYLWRVRHPNKGFQSTTSTFNDPLLSIDSRVWCPKWALFFDHGIQTHQGRERALEMVQSLECFGADAHHQFATAQIGCYLCQLCQPWHAQRHMLVLDSYQTRYEFFHNNYFSFWLVATCRYCYTSGEQQHTPATARRGSKWTWGWRWGGWGQRGWHWWTGSWVLCKLSKDCV